MRKASAMLGYVLLGAAGVAVLAGGGWYLAMRSVERPPHRVVERDGRIEIRDYPELIVAEVTRTGDRWNAVRAGFIFARERAGEKIAMTAPVTQSRDRETGADTWVVRFIMPAKYDMETLPKPADGDVRLRTLPAVRRAAIRFSGVATDDMLLENEARLRAWLDARGLSATDGATFAYYDDPLTPGPLRRNEVLLDLAVD